MITLRAIRFAPIQRDRSEAWHIVNGYAYEPAPTLPRAPAQLDYRTPTATRPDEHPIRQALATIAILLLVVALCACWAVR